MIFIRWNNDPLIDSPFPFPFSKIKKTLEGLRKKKYHKPPKNITELREALDNNPTILQDLGISLHRDHGMLFRHLHKGDDYSYCVFASPRSIELIQNNIEQKDRFFLIDATFRITPMCNVFKQSLIIHAQYGIKVSSV